MSIVNESTDPVVCKAEKFSDLAGQIVRKEKAAKESRKSNKPMQEIQITANIAKHDFESKVNKVKEMLSDGHPVKVTVMIKNSKAASVSIEAIDLMIVDILEALEGHAQTVQPLDSSVPTRKDIIVTPISIEK